MTASVHDVSPPSGWLVPANEPLFVSLTLDPGTTARSFTLTLNGVDVVTWTGGVLSATPPYVADFSTASDRLALSLTRTGGWVSGTGYVWSTAYSDSAGAGAAASGRFAHAPYATTLHPTANQSDVSPRTPITVSVDFEYGSGLGPDLAIDGVTAVAEGVFNAPDYTGRSGGAATQGWTFVTRRRAFAWGARVAARATARVSIGGLVYSESFSWSFDVAERPPSPRWAFAPTDAFLFGGNPVLVALFQVAAATLRMRGSAPHVVTLLVDLALHSEVGQLVKPLLPGPTVDLFAEDLPSDEALRAFVSRAAPFWRTALQLMAPAEEREALQRAWASDHTVEQAGALAVLLCHTTSETDNHGD